MLVTSMDIKGSLAGDPLTSMSKTYEERSRKNNGRRALIQVPVTSQSKEYQDEEC